MHTKPPLYKLLHLCVTKKSYFAHQSFILILTFICYTTFHMSRKPISIVKSVLHKTCPYNPESKDEFWCNWKPFDGNDWSQKLGSLEYAYLLAYAFFMFASGHLAERINLRYYLAIGMISSGLMTCCFGLGYFMSNHNFMFYLIVQTITGITQATGWPAVVTIMGNWFGKGRRGLIMGIWNSHTSFGNVIGSIIAGMFVSTAWGYSFVVPGLIMVFIGIVVWLIMIPYPEDIGLSSPDDQKSLVVDLKSSLDLNDDKGRVLKSHGSTKPLLPYHDRKSDKPISIWEALKIPNVIAYSFALFFAKLVSYTFLYWLPNYLNRVGQGMTPKMAGNLSTLFDIGGIFGGVLAGFASDIWLISSSKPSSSNGRSGTCAVMLILAAPMMFLYQYVAADQSYFSYFLLIICGLLVNGPYALITTAVSADLGSQNGKHDSRALATVTAIIDGTGSLGAALGPFLTGLIVPTGWSNVFVMLIIADLMALMATVFIILRNNHINRTDNLPHNRSVFSKFVSLDSLLSLKSLLILFSSLIFFCLLFFAIKMR
uniref:Sugar phosphate exchanger 3 n=1 Tax=Schmidtea mediterranea TaxID=79327 RepID=A0A0H3YJJ4_SCHMD|nr:slc37a-3 [Schmidtea mediterranea]